MLEYLNAFTDGLIKILPLSAQGTETFLYMMLGMAIGFVVGILPGLGGATTLALMLPSAAKTRISSRSIIAWLAAAVLSGPLSPLPIAS